MLTFTITSWLSYSRLEILSYILFGFIKICFISIGCLLYWLYHLVALSNTMVKFTRKPFLVSICWFYLFGGRSPMFLILFLFCLVSQSVFFKAEASKTDLLYNFVTKIASTLRTGHSLGVMASMPKQFLVS